MKYKINRKLKTLLLLSIMILLLFNSCNKAQKKEVQEVASTEQVQPTKVETPTPQKEETPAPIVEKVFDDTQLGYSVKDDKLFLNDKELPAGKIAQTTKEKDRTTYKFYDGAVLVVKDNGDMIIDFPIGITLLVDKEFMNFKTLYKGNPLTNSTIYDFITADNWYTIDYGNNTKLSFDNDNLIFKTNNLEINQSKNSTKTYFKDFLISESQIELTDALSSIIKVDYVDGNQLTHIIGGSTTFIFKSGTSIESDGDTTTIQKDGQESVIKGDIKSINYNPETGEIELSTDQEAITLNTEGEVVAQKSLVIPQEPEKIDPIIEEEIPTIEETAQTEEIIQEENPLDKQIVDDVVFDQEIIGSWDEENEIVSPFRIGVLANFSFLQKDSTFSDYGLRGDFLIENEVVNGVVIGLQIGLGADHFSTGFYKQLTTYATFSQEFTPKYSKTSYFYKIGLGSLIPITEGDTETPYFKLAISAGVNFNIDEYWMFRIGAEAAMNYRTSFVTSETVFAGLLFKFK